MKNISIPKGIRVVPDQESTSKVERYLEEEMEKGGASMKEIYRMNIAVDEIYSNVVHYSHAKWFAAEVSVSGEKIRLELWDNGIPFDPLQIEDPDISQSADDRKIGGLGIFMTKNLLDDVRYRYENGYNIITLTLNRTNNR